MFQSIYKIFRNNIKVICQLHVLDKSYVLMTSLYWICDIIEIIIYNILLLPFLYYAIDYSIDIRTFFVIEGILTLTLIFCDIYQTFYNMKYAEESKQRISHRYNKKMFAHIKNADLKELYDSERLDLTIRLLNTGVDSLTAALNMQWWAVSVIVLSVIYFGVLIKIDALLIVVALLSSIFMFFVNIKLNKLNYQNIVESAKSSRKLQYIINIFSLHKYSQDLRTTELKNVLIKSLHHVVLEIYKRINAITKKICKYTYIKNIIIFLITTSITWLYLALKYLLWHLCTLGVTDIIVAQTLMIQLCNLLIDISTIGPGLQKSSMYVDEYFEYIETESDIKENEKGDLPKRGANSIQIKNVSFSYDGQKEILKDINMEIREGEKIAIIGKNGAGKSTLVKLLLQLYKPQSGQIAMDQKPAEAYILKAYRERFGVAFQNTQLYSVSVAENVLMKTYDGEPKEKDRIIDALKNSRLYNRIDEEDKGIDTIVTKEFDESGIELSGGQTQKLAMSRVFASECGIVILDEPSAALDPIGEAEMYESMLEAMKEKTVILIAHRLSICRKVDRIYVIDNGKIAEEGTHGQLLKKNGLYAEMWNVQASAYR